MISQEILRHIYTQPKHLHGPLIQAAERQFYKENFYAFAKFCLGYKDMNPNAHEEICRALEKNSRRKVICFPRGGFKSSIATVAYTMWKLEKNPNLRVLIDSELYTNSKNFLREIKSHYQSELYQKIWGVRLSDKWTESEIILSSRTKVLKEASITVGSIGTEKTGQHYDLIISDDLNSKDNSDTKDKAQKVIDHYKYNLNILEPGGEYVIIGTRYSENDLIGWILREQLNLKSLSEGKMER